MTELEAHEALALWASASLQAFSVYMTLTFAYLTVAYLVGSRLNRFQTIAISCLYVCGSAISLMSTINQLNFYSAILSQFSGLQELTTFSGEFWKYIIAPFLGVGILVSLYFMWQVRHPKKK